MSGRIRTVKPEWAEDEVLATASPEARVLSIVLLLWSDDYGRGRAGPEALCAVKAFPAHPERYRPAFKELEAIRYVMQYRADGQTYFAIRTWKKHQKVDHPSAPRVPSPPEELGSRDTREDVEKPRETLAGDPVPRSPIPDLIPGGEESRDVARSTGMLYDYSVSATDAHALVEQWQTERDARGENRVLVIPSAWTHLAKKIIASAGGLEAAKQVVTAYVRSDHEWWAKKHWPLHILADERDFAQALLLVGAPSAQPGETVEQELARLEAKEKADRAAKRKAREEAAS